MQTFCHHIQETAASLSFNRMLKLSSNCRSLCRITLTEQPTVPVDRNLIKVTSRKNYIAINRTVPATCIKHFHYKSTKISCHLVKRFTNQSHRFMATDVSSEAVDDASEAEIDVESLVGKMLEKALERDKMVATVPKSMLIKQVKTLLNTGFTEADILEISKYPQLVKNLSQVVNVATVLLEHGVRKREITNILNIYPDIVHKTEADVLLKIEMLHDQGLGLDAVTRMICKQPNLLGKDLSGVSQRIEELKQLFKKKDTFRLLENSPNLLYCDMDFINQRFNYVFVEMGITQPQMRYTDLFSFSMEHIHARHMFLVRAGFFKNLKKKAGQRDLNPILEMILDTSDEEFVKTFGNMTVTDYKTFKKLLLRDRVILKADEDYLED